jgi:hypothetical protein
LQTDQHPSIYDSYASVFGNSLDFLAKINLPMRTQNRVKLGKLGCLEKSAISKDRKI